MNSAGRSGDPAGWIRVWDPLVRIFHWTLVAGFTVAYASGEEESALHEWAGYLVLALVAVRLVWGVIGTRHARFGDFVFGPGTVLSYASDLWRGRARRYLGHNPLGGWMVVALLLSLTLSCVSGILTLDPPAGWRALAPMVNAHANGREGDVEGSEADEWLGEFHEAVSNFTLLLVVLHIVGVLVSSLAHRENLVRAMITGTKRPP